MNIEEVKELARIWQEENKESRAVMVIAIEATEVSEEETKAETISYVDGSAFLCKEAIKGIMNDDNPKNVFRKVLNRANLEVAIEKITEIGRN